MQLTKFVCRRLAEKCLTKFLCGIKFNLQENYLAAIKLKLNMNSKTAFIKNTAPYLALLLFALFLITKFLKPGGAQPADTTTNTVVHQNVIPLNAHLIYTKHALCRMKCRQIDESEIQEIIAAGTVNQNKSNANDQPCPTVALEGTSHDNQQLRIVFARCGDQVKVVTCIDLKNNYECDCN